MARALGQILSELNSVYNPQKDVYKQQIAAVDPQAQAEMQGLNAAKTDAFAGIDQTANRRGMFYSGLPIAEEQKYTGQQYLPSLANMRAKYAQQKFDLTNALNKVTSDQYNQAETIHQTELDREEKQREFAANLAAQERASRAAAAASSPGFSFGDGGGGAAAGSPQAMASYQQKANGGYAFTDHNGKPISAALYSKATGTPFRQLLQQMAASGDRGAKTALGFVGNDFGYDPRKIKNTQLANLYNALVWGTGRKANSNVFNVGGISATTGGTNFNYRPNGNIPGLSF